MEDSGDSVGRLAGCEDGRVGSHLVVRDDVLKGGGVLSVSVVV